MQPFEIVVIGFGVLTAIALFTLDLRRAKTDIAIGMILMGGAASEVYFEGYRWHMVGAYLGVVLVLVALLSRSRKGSRLIRCMLGSSLVGFAASVGAATLFPVFNFPPLNGVYRVGTVILEFPVSPLEEEGSARKEERKLVVQLFYPAEPSPGKDSIYTLAGLATRFKPQLRRVQTLAVVNATIALSEQAYPVIIYSHSWNGSRLENLALVQQLASHGYVVACVDDTEYTPTTVFANGSTRRHAGEHWLDFSSQNSLEKSIQRARRQLDGRVEDVSFVLDQLSLMNRGTLTSQFVGRLKTDRAGVLGFSFGGTTAAQACRVDPRFTAGVNLDGYAFTVADATAIPRPFLSMTESVPADEDTMVHDHARRAEWLYDRIEFERIASAIRSSGGYYLTVRGTKHLNFSDFPLYSRLRFYTGAGSINPLRALYIVSSYSVAFFDQYLSDEPSVLLQKASPSFPEVAFVLGQPTETAVIQ